MNRHSANIVVEVLAFGQVKGRTLAAIQLISGDVKPGVILEVENTGMKWCVVGFMFLPAEAWQKGLRGVELERLDHAECLCEGIRLVSTDKTR